MGSWYIVKENYKRTLIPNHSPGPTVEMASGLVDGEDAELEVFLTEQEAEEERTTVISMSPYSKSDNDTTIHIYHYHILYSTTYYAPVLYFNASFLGT